MRKQLLVSVDRGETRVAILESEGSPSAGKRQKKGQSQDDWRVAELYIERKRERGIAGNIYKGTVDNVLGWTASARVRLDSTLAHAHDA